MLQSCKLVSTCGFFDKIKLIIEMQTGIYANYIRLDEWIIDMKVVDDILLLRS